MNVREALRRCNFKIGTLDDTGGKAINNIVDQRNVVDELNTQLQQYANITKGIQDIYSFPLNAGQPFIDAPELALRSEAYYYAFIVSRGTIFPIDMRNPNDVYPIFRYNPQSGITSWFMPWGSGKKQFFSAFPMNNLTTLTTTTSALITSVATTIPVASTAGFMNNSGRITIGEEKIMYSSKDATNFYGCERGTEGTVAVEHSASSTVQENNVVLYYSRLPVKIIITDNNFISEATLGREIEVVEEHLEGIIKAVAYNILIKLDPTRATEYKQDYDVLYAQYARDIKKGYWRGRQGTNIREPYFNESGTPYFTNLIY